MDMTRQEITKWLIICIPVSRTYLRIKEGNFEIDHLKEWVQPILDFLWSWRAPININNFVFLILEYNSSML